MPSSQINPATYQQQLDEKVLRIRRQFSSLGLQELDVMASAPLNFRMRAEFKLWHQHGDCYFVMYQPGESSKPYRVDQLPIASALVNRLMKELIEAIKVSKVLSHKLFQVEFLTTLSGQSLVSLIYHKKLDDQWHQLATSLAKSLGTQIIGRSKKQKRIIENDYVIEALTVNRQEYRYQQLEGGFTQPNAGVNQQMLEWTLANSKGNGGDLLELYCGNGNFTMVLAQNFKHVLATEISKTSVKSVHFNFALNAIDNVTVARVSSEECAQALAGVRKFRRLKDIDLDNYQFSTVLVDPPRAGLDEVTEQWISRFENIIYISCNPDTLQKNLEYLCKTHRIKRFAIFDQFPYTAHIECGVILQRLTGDDDE